MGRRSVNQGPSQSELHMQGELDRARRELAKLKKGALAAGAASAAEAAASVAAEAAAPAPAIPVPAAPDAVAGRPAAAPGSPEEVETLRRLVAELTATRQRLSRLYFSQVEENRQRGRRLHQILESIGQINSELDLDTLLPRIAGIVSTSLGFRIVLIRILDPGSDRLRARAFAGIDDAGRAQLERTDVTVEEFGSWLREEFRVSRSYFISHQHEFSRQLPEGYRPSLGPREEWEWHEDDVLLVPLQNRNGDLVGYFSVDDPVDRLVPSTETIELLEIFGYHAVVAIENARLYQEREQQTRQLKESGQRAQELHALKSTFVSTISHELRTPLTALRAFLDTLLSAPEGEVPPDRLRHILGIMNEETQRLARLIESVLDLNRFDSGDLRLEREPVDIADIVEDTVRLLAPAAETGEVSLKVVNDCADTRMEADPDQMRQLVLHLGSNAVKFTPPGGAVTVFLSGSADEIALRVEDTGIGIPEAALEKGVRALLSGGLVAGPPLRRSGARAGGLQVHRRMARGAHHRRERSRPRLVLHRGAATAERTAGGFAVGSIGAAGVGGPLEAGDRDGGRGHGRARGLPAGPRAGRGPHRARGHRSRRARDARDAHPHGLRGRRLGGREPPPGVRVERPGVERDRRLGPGALPDAHLPLGAARGGRGPARRAQRDRPRLGRALRRAGLRAAAPPGRARGRHVGRPAARGRRPLRAWRTPRARCARCSATSSAAAPRRPAACGSPARWRGSWGWTSPRSRPSPSRPACTTSA